jgi:CheY-like chemotaxis protein
LHAGVHCDNRGDVSHVSMHIVVAEDNREEAGQLGQWLSSLGHQASFADTGVAAVECCKAIRPAVALVDLLIPGLDGFEVARRIQQWVPLIVAITSLRNLAADEVARATGFRAFLRKPYTLEDLRSVLTPAGGT